MTTWVKAALATIVVVGSLVGSARPVFGEVKCWEGTIVLPTYTWEEDINPRFWALESGAPDAAPPLTALIYPYTMQDYLSRTKVDRTYRALFLENEYLKVTCLPELGGRLHSVLDKTTGDEMFHLNHVIKPSMIGMRGAWISGGVEWNAGPQGHTVTCVSPVDVALGSDPDGSRFLEVANLEKSQRTRWTVRLTLHPGRAYLDEQIHLVNPTDALSPYYFWNCTAFPCRSGTRFIFPMTLGADHSAAKFFTWPLHEGRDLTWLKNYETWASIFARDCTFDFFGAYDVEADRGLVQAADHHQLSGKKAWTWGTWDFGLVSEKNLTDDDGPYIEVQSGPLPTQSDYGALWPHEQVAWQEWWYPVHGLGDEFEFATRAVAVQTRRTDGRFEVRLLATGQYPGATCMFRQERKTLLEQKVDLGPAQPQVLKATVAGDDPVKIMVVAADGEVLASFESPLAVPKIEPPDAETLKPKPDDELTAEETYLRGRKHDLATNRAQAREYYEKALAQDPGQVGALRGLAVLAVEAADYLAAIPLLEQALARDPTDGLCWYFLGVSHLKLENERAAVHCGYQAARCFGTAAPGYDLAGRAYMRLHEYSQANDAFYDATQADYRDDLARHHWLLALYADRDRIGDFIDRSPTALLPRALRALSQPGELENFAKGVRDTVGEMDFELLDVGLTLADLGLYSEAVKIVSAACVAPLPAAERSPLVLYHLAYWSSRLADATGARDYLRQAAGLYRDREFASHPDTVRVLEFAIQQQPNDAHAHLQLGNLYAHLGRLAAAAEHWQKAAELKPALSVAHRNLGLYSRMVEKDLPKAAACYRQAIDARPSDQTLYRDLAQILIADGQRPEAIRVLESAPSEQPRRADVMLALAQAYLDEQRYDEVIALLESTGYFVAWEGQTTTWTIFNQAHVARGRARLAEQKFDAALADFDAALTYPANLGVGRSNKPEHAPALYWRGKALAALRQPDAARRAWQEGAAGAEGSTEQNEYRQRCTDALQSGE